MRIILRADNTPLTRGICNKFYKLAVFFVFLFMNISWDIILEK